MTTALADATKEILTVLSPLSSEERARVVRAALTLLGDNMPSGGNNASPEEGQAGKSERRSNQWASKQGLTEERIEQYFHIEEDKVTLLELPSSLGSNKEKAVAIYLLIGLGKYLLKGDPAFSDTEARELCTQFGCYDQGNHSKIYKDFGNRATGAKGSGWKLTNPGLAAAAALLKA